MFFLALSITSFFAVGSTGVAQAGNAQYGCSTKQGTALRALHVWETKPTPKKGYKNVFSAAPGGKVVFLAVNGNGTGTTATVYTSTNNKKATLRLWAAANQWCEVVVNLRTT